MSNNREIWVRDGLREAARIADGFGPGEAELADAPLLEDWLVEVLPGGLHCLVGAVSAHPTIPDGICTTSPILVMSTAGGWARTVSRYYRLGPLPPRPARIGGQR